MGRAGGVSERAVNVSSQESGLSSGERGGAASVRVASRRIVGIGEFAVSALATDTIVTHALGSCIAVCIWDPGAGVGGLLHFLLPDSAINPDRAKTQPATFANSGLPLLFQAAYSLGLDKKRCRVRLVGGAEIARLGGHQLAERRQTQPARGPQHPVA